MPEQPHVCKATDRPVWVLNVTTGNDKTGGAWVDHLDELRAWLGAHDLVADEIASTAVVRRADGTKQLHARRYAKASCDEHDRHRYVDWTTDEALSELVIVPLKADPPEIPGTAAR